MNTVNPHIQASARERLGKASAHATQQTANPPPSERDLRTAVPGARNTALFVSDEAFKRQAQAMGYLQMLDGSWYHGKMGFTVQPVSHNGLHTHRGLTLSKLEDTLHQQRADAHRRRYWAGIVALSVLLVVVLLALLWPDRANAEGRALAGDCTTTYTLLPGQSGEWKCYHAYYPGTLLVYVQSGNPKVLASVASQNTTNNPQYVQLTLHNPSSKLQRGTATALLFTP